MVHSTIDRLSAKYIERDSKNQRELAKPEHAPGLDSSSDLSYDAAMISIDVRWIQLLLVLVAVAGILLGFLSLMSPKQSVALYQRMMRFFNWRVEPINYDREMKTTRFLGLLMIVLNLLMVVALFKPGVFPRFG